MRNLKSSLLVFLMSAAFVSGCSSVRTADVPVNDTMLVYQLPFDLTYLRTLEALDQMPEWELQETEKEKGVIVVRNTNFSAFTEADKRIAMILIKRVDRQETAVLLAPHSQGVIGGDQLLERIRGVLDTEM